MLADLKPDSKSSRMRDQALLSRTCGTGGPAFDVDEVSELFTTSLRLREHAKAAAPKPTWAKAGTASASYGSASQQSGSHQWRESRVCRPPARAAELRCDFAAPGGLEPPTDAEPTIARSLAIGILSAPILGRK